LIFIYIDYWTAVIANLFTFKVPEIPDAEVPAGEEVDILLPKITTPEPVL
jgi:hypothetical protein